jgi:hypothetical protein
MRDKTKHDLITAAVVMALLVFVSYCAEAKPSIKRQYVEFTWSPPTVTKDNKAITEELGFDVYIARLRGQGAEEYVKRGSTKENSFGFRSQKRGCFSAYVVTYYLETPNENRSDKSRNLVFCVWR